VVARRERPALACRRKKQQQQQQQQKKKKKKKKKKNAGETPTGRKGKMPSARG
jgi:predicted amidophosphoribosyltransferase